MANTSVPVIKTAIGAPAWRGTFEAIAREPRSFALELVEVEPIHKAFAPMARKGAYDVSEMAIVTALQALAYGKPLVILPVTLAARFQHRCIIKRRNSNLSVADLRGHPVAVRAYTQTTGVWLRGILQNDYGVPAETIRWITQDDAHLAEYADPAFVERVPKGKSLPDLLRAGVVDAAILGNDLPDDPDFEALIPSPATAADEWFARHGVVPINHLLVVREDVAAAHPDAIRDLWRMMLAAHAAKGSDAARLPIGTRAIRPALDMLLLYCAQQGLLPRPLDADEVFARAVALLGDC